MNDRELTSTAAVLAAPRLDWGAVVRYGGISWQLAGRDVTRDWGAVALARERAPGRFEWAYAVHARGVDGWDLDAAAENDHPWPVGPASGRPHWDGFQHLSHSHVSVDLDTGLGFAIVGGIAGDRVTRIEMRSPYDVHEVPFSADSGAFVAVVSVREPAEFGLSAFDAAGVVIDTVDSDG